MKRIRWKWLLPILQLVFALACHVYDPHEYRVQARRDHAVDNLGYRYQNNPAIYGRISQGINFPALVLGYPFRNDDNALYERNSEFTLIWIAPKDIGFFLGIVSFWYWVGRILEKRLGLIQGTTRPRLARIAGLACGVVFGMLTAAYACQMIAREFRPWRQIGGFGIAWAAILIAYFGWRLTQEFGAAHRERS